MSAKWTGVRDEKSDGGFWHGYFYSPFIRPSRNSCYMSGDGFRHLRNVEVKLEVREVVYMSLQVGVIWGMRTHRS